MAKRSKRKSGLLTSQQVRWFVALGLLAFLWYVAPGYGRSFNFFNVFHGGETSYAYEEDDYDDYDYENDGLENIDLVGNWTEDIYESIETATEAWDEDYSEVEYLDGDDYQDLVKEVGRPESIYRFDDGYGNDQATASWSAHSEEDDTYVTVDVTYLEDNDMIIEKYCYSY